MNDSISSLPEVHDTRRHHGFSLKKPDKAHSTLSLFVSPRKAAKASYKWKESGDDHSVEKKHPGKMWKIGLPFAHHSDKKKPKEPEHPLQSSRAPSYQSLSYTPVVTSLLAQPISSSGPRNGALARGASFNPSSPRKAGALRKGPGSRRNMLARGGSLSNVADAAIPEDRSECFKPGSKSEELGGRKAPSERGVTMRKSSSLGSMAPGGRKQSPVRSSRQRPPRARGVQLKKSGSLGSLVPGKKQARRDTMSLNSSFSCSSPVSSPQRARGTLSIPKSPSRKASLPRTDGLLLTPTKKEKNTQCITPVSSPKRGVGGRPPSSPRRVGGGAASPSRLSPDRRAAMLKRHTSLPANASPKALAAPTIADKRGELPRSTSLNPANTPSTFPRMNFSNLNDAIAGYDDICESCQSLTTIDSNEDGDTMMDSADSLGNLLGGDSDSEEEEELLF